MIKSIKQFIDFFYIKPLRFIPLHTFRYAAMGSINLLITWVVYWFCFHFILQKQDTDLGFFVFSAEILSVIITFLITVFPGYWLISRIAFTESKLKSGTQLFRYAQVAAGNLVINLFGVKFLTHYCGFYPTIAMITTSIVPVILSYILQRFYSFRGHKKL